MRFLGYDFELFKRSSERRYQPKGPTDDYWYTPFQFASPTLSGAVVNPVTALTHPAVFACVKVISETVAMMPLILYKRLGNDKRERASEHPLFRILKMAPNKRTTAMQFWQEMVGVYLLNRRGAFAQIIPRADGKASELYMLDTNRLEESIHPDTREPVFRYTKLSGEFTYFKDKDLFRLCGPAGLSPIDCLREAIGLGIMLDQYNSNFYANNASPTGVLTLPAGQILSDKAKDRLREDWKKKFSGKNYGSNIAVLEEGLTWQQMGLSQVDSEINDTEKVNDLDVCRGFRMPPHKIGILDDAKFNNIESQNIDFLTDTILPHLTRVVQVIDRDLLRTEKEDKYYAEHTMDALLRGDTLTRNKSYAVGRQWGYLSVNEIRAMENRNPVDGGDTYLQPLNMIDAEEATDLLLAGADDGAQPDVKKDGQDPSDPTLKKSKNTFIVGLDERFAALGKNIEKLTEIVQNREKVTDNAPKPPIFDRNRVSAEIAPLRSAVLEALGDAYGRAMFKESQAAKRREKFNAETFYPEHRAFVDKITEAIVRSYHHQVRLVAQSCGGKTVTATTVPPLVKGLMDETWNRYYNEFKEAGERAAQHSETLAESVADRIEHLCLWNLNKE